MSPLELVRMLKAVPFLPFEIQLSSGATYVVNHPECLVVGKNTSFLFRPSAEQGVFEDDWVRFSNLHVNYIRPFSSAQSK